MTVEPISAELFEQAVRAAVLAPSQHNAQPWRFRLAAGALEVHGDPARVPPLADRAGWGMRIGCGAAAANAQLTLADAGIRTRLTCCPTDGDESLLARLVPVGTGPATPVEQQLVAAIPKRHSHRRPFAATPVPADARAALVATAAAHGGWLTLITEVAQREQVEAILAVAERSLREDPAYAAELAEWINPGAAGTGIPEHAAGVAPEQSDELSLRDFGGTPRTRFETFEPEPLIAVLGTDSDTRHDEVAAGVALQHALLTATVAGLAASLMSQPIEVPAARQKLNAVLLRTGVPQILLRIGYGSATFATPRRPITDVIDP